MLYFVQVSSSKYQHRAKKLSAVTTICNDLHNQSPYTYYKDMFKIASSDVYYIYSSPTQTPLDTSFTTTKKDQNCVYFHQLNY